MNFEMLTVLTSSVFGPMGIMEVSEIWVRLINGLTVAMPSMFAPHRPSSGVPKFIVFSLMSVVITWAAVMHGTKMRRQVRVTRFGNTEPVGDGPMERIISGVPL